MEPQQPTQISKSTAFLQGFVVLFSGVEDEMRKRATEFVLRNGGKCVDRFCKEVTCGIVGRVGSAGFKELKGAKVPLLSLKWLQDCSASKSLAQMDSPKYKVHYCTGLNVVCTQLTLDERTRVQQLVENGGGVYSDLFIGKLCTHLIAKTPDGEKYLSAKKCGTIRTVTIAWVEECAKQKGLYTMGLFASCSHDLCLLPVLHA
jgi:hypothetical protein